MRPAMLAEKGLQIDMGDCGMQCSNHPDQTNITGGICPVCLQEKLGKLVSSSAATSSFPIAVFPFSSPSSSPSFRSERGGATTAATASVPPSDRHSYSKRTRIPFLPTKKKKKDPLPLAASSDQASFVFKRSNSVAAAAAWPGFHFTVADRDTPRSRGLWSFLYLSKHAGNSKNDSFKSSSSTMGAFSSNGSFLQRSKEEEMAVVDENDSPIQVAFDRKVARSRSVGCGSRSFSGNFFERISTGFGDCTLRRVESQRESKRQINSAHRHGGGGGGGQDCAKQRVKCGGIFSGFTITSSSSSSSSSSCLVCSSAEDNYVNGKPPSAASGGHHLVNGRSKSWGWAFASPTRAFSKREASSKNTTPNLKATPSPLL